MITFEILCQKGFEMLSLSFPHGFYSMALKKRWRIKYSFIPSITRLLMDSFVSVMKVLKANPRILS